MKNHLLPYLTVFVLLVGCAAFKPAKKEVVGNTFYCSSPKLEVEVSQPLQFVGEKPMRQDFEGRDYQRPGTAYHRYFIFRGPDNLFAITVIKLPRDWQYMPPSFEDVKNKLDSGKQKLGGYEYHYVTLKNGPYIQRMFIRNAYADTVRIQFLYLEKEKLELLSEKEQLREFNKNCEAAFTVK